MTELPECAWLDASVHVISDKTGLRAAVRIGGGQMKNVYDFDWSKFIKTACDVLNDSGECDDARPMTRDEVKAYQDEDDD